MFFATGRSSALALLGTLGELTSREKSTTYLTISGQNKHAASCTSCKFSCNTLSGNERRQFVHVTTMKGTPLESFPFRGIQTGADWLRCSVLRWAEVSSSRATVLSNTAGPEPFLEWKASAITPPGTESPDRYAPLLAITEIWGNLRRKTDSSSKPDMCGMFRSEMMRSGKLGAFSCNRASRPFSAVLTTYPLARNKRAWLSRTDFSSSTTRI